MVSSLGGQLVTFDIGIILSLIGYGLYKKGHNMLGNDTSFGFIAGGVVSTGGGE